MIVVLDHGLFFLFFFLSFFVEVMYLDFFFFGDHLIRLLIIAHVVSTGAQVLGKSHCFTLVLVHFLTMHSLIVVSAINLILNVLTITAISACLFIHSLLSFAFFEELRS